MRANNSSPIRILLLESDSSTSRSIELYLRGLTSHDLVVKSIATPEQIYTVLRESWDAIVVDEYNDSPAQVSLVEKTAEAVVHLPLIRLGKHSDGMITSGAETTLDETLPKLLVGAAPLLRGIAHLIERRRLERRLEELEAKLREASDLDLASGLHNENYMRERLLQEFNASVRYSKSLTICLFEIGGFETINEAYGFEVANVVLRECGKMILASIRNTDFASRMSSDLFCIAFPNSALEAAMVGVERIRDATAHKVFTGKSHENFTIEASYGVVQLGPQHRQLADLLSSLRQALQMAKARGPGRIEIGHQARMAG